jgi:DNA-binding LacI/PurR family transcriptional regulator
MGGRAGELALSIIEARKPPEPQTVLIQPKLIVRASTARRPPGERRTPKPPVVAAITA